MIKPWSGSNLQVESNQPEIEENRPGRLSPPLLTSLDTIVGLYGMPVADFTVSAVAIDLERNQDGANG